MNTSDEPVLTPLLSEGSRPESPADELSQELDTSFVIQAIHTRADAITPLLDEILNSHVPHRWGINE